MTKSTETKPRFEVARNPQPPGHWLVLDHDEKRGIPFAHESTARCAAEDFTTGGGVPAYYFGLADLYPTEEASNDDH